MATSPSRRRAKPEPVDNADAPLRRRWVLVAGGVALVVFLLVSVLAVLAVVRRDEVALSVDDWSLSRGDLDQYLEGTSSNVLYQQALIQQGRPMEARVEGSDDFAPQFVALSLNDLLQFQIAEQVVLGRGGQLEQADREAAGRTLTAMLVTSGGQLTGSGAGDDEDGRSSTLETILDQFGESRVVLEDGVAWLAALRRSVVAEMGPDVTQEAALAQVDELLAEAKRAATIEVAGDLGRWDSAALLIVAVDVSNAGLVPVGPDSTGTSIPSSSDTSAPATTATSTP